MSELHKLISAIRYECAPGVHTFGSCSKCGTYPARGGGICLTCRIFELDDLVGVNLSRKFTNATQTAHDAIGEMEAVLNQRVESKEE